MGTFAPGFIEVRMSRSVAIIITSFKARGPPIVKGAAFPRFLQRLYAFTLASIEIRWQ